MTKFNTKDSISTAKNWLSGTVTALEKEDYLLQVLLDKNKLQPEERAIIIKSKNLLLETLLKLDEITLQIAC
jgi:hypothetical protein